MRATCLKLYQRTVLGHPLITIFLLLLLVAGVGYYAKDFHLDASADSLLLENDQDLKYFRTINDRYSNDEFLLITYRPQGKDLYSDAVLDDLRQLRDQLLQLDRVASVFSILDAPLIDSPRLTMGELSEGVRSLETAAVDRSLARQEFQNSPLYKSLLTSPDGETTALQVVLKTDEKLNSLLKERNQLREKRSEQPLSASEESRLHQLSRDYDSYSQQFSEQQSADVARIRDILQQHQQQAQLFLGGVPMIVSDMIDFIRHDLASFGVGVLIFLVSMLFVIFRRLQWIVLPMLCCAAAVLFMFGFLGLVGWKVTVVSSNFTSLLLIITLSLCVHLVVRYSELDEEMPGASHGEKVKEMVRSKAVPSIYTALTTIVAFVSLLTSDIRPVIDFGWMMAIGIAFSLLLSFALFPAGLKLCRGPRHFQPRFDITGLITRSCATAVEHHGRTTLLTFLAIALISLIGISKLTVENRFIDYFKPTTEIYQGMELIDQQLGGTTPLDIILDADSEFLAGLKTQNNAEEDAFDSAFSDTTGSTSANSLDDEFDDFFAEDEADAGISGSSYWYNSYRIDSLARVHNYLDQLPETGKVLSMSTTMTLMQLLNEDRPLDNISLSVIHKKMPPAIETALFRPYMSDDGNQVRFSLRVIDSDPGLRRDALLKKIRSDLTGELGLEPEQVHLTGMFVLYNNVLQSLFKSQIMTIGVVFLVIMGMFLLQFRSLRLALIAIIPNLISAGTVLGLMGLLGIPLDIMTITIAAITIGIAVDDTIHYVHRFNEELAVDGDHLAAMKRSHNSVGRAMYYTSVTIICGFSILTLSSFNPTIYFGLFTGLAMLVAMFANLTLLALLLMKWK